MSGHTPGPWEARVVTTRHDGKDIWRVEGDGFSMHTSNGVHASLIAAAPELLEALMALLPIAESVGDDFSVDDAILALGKARNAIAKARGDA